MVVYEENPFVVSLSPASSVSSSSPFSPDPTNIYIYISVYIYIHIYIYMYMTLPLASSNGCGCVDQPFSPLVTLSPSVGMGLSPPLVWFDI